VLVRVEAITCGRICSERDGCWTCLLRPPSWPGSSPCWPLRSQD